MKHYTINFSVLLLLGIASIPVIGQSVKKSASQAPNIVIIFMDDMGYGDLECYGGFTYKTPNINRLAAQGMRFTQFYVAQAVCSASRAALLTGCYSNRVGIFGALFPWSKIALNPEEETIPELLKKKGYKTGMVGKWHLGQKLPFLPLQHGFDEYLGLPYSNDMWKVNYDGGPVTDTSSNKYRFPPLLLIEGNEQVREIKTLEHQGELTTIYTDRAVSFIRKNKSKPFFLYLAHSMPHIPLGVSPKNKGKSGSGLYGDVMMEIDWSVEQVIKTLDEEGLTKNTLVVFLSDNGPWLNFGNHAGSSGGLREGKGTVWEGGVRVPCIMKWPGKIPAGSVCSEIAATMDLLPTITKICQAPRPQKKIDGVDIWSLMTAQPGAKPRDEFVYYYNENNLKAVRKGQWKLVFPAMSQTYKKTIRGADGFPGRIAIDSVKLALYDLRTDPGETLDVKEQHPEIVQQLTTIADRYRKELGDNLTKSIGLEVRPAAKVVFP